MNIGTFQAKTHFSEIIEEVQLGKEYTVTKRGKPVARIIPFVEYKTSRTEVVQKLRDFQKTMNKKPFNILKVIADGRK